MTSKKYTFSTFETCTFAQYNQNEYGAGLCMNPFLKWPGGKRWLANMIKDIAPQQYSKYYEPFLGGGAVFFSLAPKNALISDVNPELVNLYTAMRDCPMDLKQYMCDHNRLHSKEYYYRIRSAQFTEPVERAARFLYLNRTCYNGMYRVNRQGQFNVPIGTKSNCIYDIELFEEYARMLKNVDICTNDFSATIQQATAGDLIFADPPYASAQKNDTSFLKYNDRLFTWDDQIRLHNALVAARIRGVSIILTNANNQEIKDLYSNSGFFIMEVSRTSNIASKTEKRTIVSELIITSFPHRNA